MGYLLSVAAHVGDSDPRQAVRGANAEIVNVAPLYAAASAGEDAGGDTSRANVLAGD